MTYENASSAATDLRAFGDLVLDAWSTGLDRDWSVPAGTLEWSCFRTADHTVDCVQSYAFLLASGRQDSYPPFNEMHALDGATPSDLLDGLRGAVTMLWAVVVTAGSDTRAILRRRPAVEGGAPPDFAARGSLEMVLHAHDVCAGLGITFDPPSQCCRRLRDHTSGWPHARTVESTDDAWSDILRRSGRTPA